ncbi:MAG: elongation factor G [Verrucomicrobiota bacterium]
MKLEQTSRRRNLGIIAHVDAGKTTVTERILFFTGRIHRAGEVHTGDTAMDFDPEERQHGITIQSAATTVAWRDHALTIIDTPGHIDFNLEVRRALRVLDGAVMVFDGVAGVEPQSETNWRLADEYRVPRIAFINKLDRRGADFDRVCREMESRLQARVMPLQLPLVSGESLEGVIDVLRGVVIRWTDESGLNPVEEPVSAELQSAVAMARQKIVELAVELEESSVDRYLAGERIGLEELRALIRRGTMAGTFVPVLCGSALKNRGIQPLLDAVVDYLPAPEDRAALADEKAGPASLSALVFKIADNGSFGSRTIVRLYSGGLKPGQLLENSRTGRTERVSRLFRQQAGREEEMESAVAGDIVALAGLKDTRTGDTLGLPGKVTELERIHIPEPVTTQVIESDNREHKERLSAALAKLVRADPALRLAVNATTGQLEISGMGELHLSVLREKLERQLGTPLRMGRPQVAYKETITRAAETAWRHRKQGGGPGQFADLTLRIEPLERGAGIVFESRISGGAIPSEFIPAVEQGIRARAAAGLVRGAPVTDFRTVLLDGKTHPNDSSALAFQIAGRDAMDALLCEAGAVLLQPVMRVTVTAPEETTGAIMGDLTRRRGLVTGQSALSGAAVIQARAPLAGMFGYIGDLRSLTSGRAGFTMEFHGYEPVV